MHFLEDRKNRFKNQKSRATAKPLTIDVVRHMQR